MTEQERKDLVAYRLSRAQATLREIELQMQIKMWNTAVNRLYYACFYAVGALLTEHNIPSKTHAGTRQLFGLHFVKTGLVETASGEFYSKLFTMRQRGDYDDYFDFTEDDVQALLGPAQKLVGAIEALLIKQ